MKCKCCKRNNKDLRMGFCFDCADSESIIAEGTDMHDEPVRKNEGFSPHMDKVRRILENGGLTKN